MQETQLNTDIRRWSAEVDLALRKAENIIRVQNRFPPLDFNHVRIHDKQGLRLLNWKVWCKRYHISLEQLLVILLKRNAKHRRMMKDPSTLTLGLSLASLTGQGARETIEQELLKLYPSNENLRAEQPQPEPLDAIDYDNSAAMYQRYDAQMRKRHLQKALAQTKVKRAHRHA